MVRGMGGAEAAWVPACAGMSGGWGWSGRAFGLGLLLLFRVGRGGGQVAQVLGDVEGQVEPFAQTRT
jgi:hypothetical protein